MQQLSFKTIYSVINRPDVAGAVLQSALLLINSLINNSVSQPFHHNLQNIINHKPEELWEMTF